jgi:signal transduction histidine kinase
VTGTERAGQADNNSVRDATTGNGRGDNSQGSTAVSNRAELADVGVLALAGRLDAARRAVAAGDAYRQRLGQDLHDGVQQRLTALRIRLALAAEASKDRGDHTVTTVLNAFGDEVNRAIDELRAFAHGVYPEVLTSGGLSRALAAAARQMPQPVTVLTPGIKRYPTEIETAVYFACLAALDNAAKYAEAAQITVRVWDHGNALHFTISDTGSGFEPQHTAPGAGIANMRNRIVALGGTLTIDSAPSHGTVVEGNIPHAP